MSQGKLKIFYVYMHNSTDRSDDEVYKVKARDEEHARHVASKDMNRQGRFTVGWVKPYVAQNEHDRQLLKDHRWWATDKTHVR